MHGVLETQPSKLLLNGPWLLAQLNWWLWRKTCDANVSYWRSKFFMRKQRFTRMNISTLNVFQLWFVYRLNYLSQGHLLVFAIFTNGSNMFMSYYCHLCICITFSISLTRRKSRNCCKSLMLKANNIKCHTEFITCGQMPLVI